MITQRKTIQEHTNALRVKAMTLKKSSTIRQDNDNNNNNSSNSCDAINHKIKDTVDEVIRKQNQIAHMMALVQMTPSRLEEQRDKVLYFIKREKK